LFHWPSSTAGGKDLAGFIAEPVKRVWTTQGNSIARTISYIVIKSPIIFEASRQAASKQMKTRGGGLESNLLKTALQQGV